MPNLVHAADSCLFAQIHPADREKTLALNCSARYQGVDEWFLAAKLHLRRGVAPAPAGQFRRPLR